MVLGCRLWAATGDAAGRAQAWPHRERDKGHEAVAALDKEFFKSKQPESKTLSPVCTGTLLYGSPYYTGSYNYGPPWGPVVSEIPAWANKDWWERAVSLLEHPRTLSPKA